MENKHNYKRQIIILDFKKNLRNYKKRTPFRFCIENLHFFQSPDYPVAEETWYPAHIHHIAATGLRCILELNEDNDRKGVIDDEDGIHLFFERQGDEVIISDYTFYTEPSITVEYNNLFNAWVNFANNVKNTVINVHPELKNYLWWNQESETINEYLSRCYKYYNQSKEILERDYQVWFENECA